MRGSHPPAQGLKRKQRSNQQRWQLCVIALTVFEQLYSLLAAKTPRDAQASGVDTLEFWPTAAREALVLRADYILQL